MCHGLLWRRENQDRPLEEWNKVQLLDDRDGDLHLKNLRVYEAKTEQEALNLLFLGNINRVTSETPMNQVGVLLHRGLTAACTKMTGAAASVERMRREPAVAISPE